MHCMPAPCCPCQVAISTLPGCQRRALHSAIAMQLGVGIGLPLPAVDEANVTLLLPTNAQVRSHHTLPFIRLTQPVY